VNLRCVPTGRSPQQQRHVSRAKRRSVLEQPVASAIHPLENARAAQPGETQLDAEPARDAVADVTPIIKSVARDLNGAGHGATPRRTHASGSELRFEGAARDLLLAWQIEPAGPPVAAEVLPEVRQLKRRAQGI